MAAWRQNSIGSGPVARSPLVEIGGFRASPSHDPLEANRGTAMAKAYYSTVFEQKAEKVWEIVRDFNNYPVWVGGAGESAIEDGIRRRGRRRQERASIRSGGSGSGYWRSPTSSARRPTNSVVRPRCR